MYSMSCFFKKKKISLLSSQLMNQYRMVQQQNHAYRLQQQMQIQNQQQSNQQLVSNPQQGFPQTQSSPIGVLNISLNTTYYCKLFKIIIQNFA